MRTFTHARTRSRQECDCDNEEGSCERCAVRLTLDARGTEPESYRLVTSADLVSHVRAAWAAHRGGGISMPLLVCAFGYRW